MVPKNCIDYRLWIRCLSIHESNHKNCNSISLVKDKFNLISNWLITFQSNLVFKDGFFWQKVDDFLLRRLEDTREYSIYYCNWKQKKFLINFLLYSCSTATFYILGCRLVFLLLCGYLVYIHLCCQLAYLYLFVNLYIFTYVVIVIIFLFFFWFFCIWACFFYNGR